MLIGSPGGNASKQSQSYKVSIPTLWAKDMGISKEQREIKLTYSDKKIIIERVQ